MQNPIIARFLGANEPVITTSTLRPDIVHYPIMGLPWTVFDHDDAIMTIQQMSFLGSHLQLIEMSVWMDTALSLTTEGPCCFLVLMIEGFFRYYKADNLAFYAMGGAMYMGYCPSTELILRVGPGRHSALVMSIDRGWLSNMEHINGELKPLVRQLRTKNPETTILPMCRADRNILELLDKIRLDQVHNLFRRKAETVVVLSEMVNHYQIQLKKGNIIKSQLSADVANGIFGYIQQHYHMDHKVRMETISVVLGVSDWKLREYAQLLFGQSIPNHVRVLRMHDIVRLLETTREPVGKLAIQVGFTNLPHFYQAFRSFYGRSPQSFRKNRKKDQ